MLLRTKMRFRRIATRARAKNLAFGLYFNIVPGVPDPPAHKAAYAPNLRRPFGAHPAPIPFASNLMAACLTASKNFVESNSNPDSSI